MGTNQTGEGIRLRHACVKLLPLASRFGPLQAVATHRGKSRYMYILWLPLKEHCQVYICLKHADQAT